MLNLVRLLLGQIAVCHLRVEVVGAGVFDGLLKLGGIDAQLLGDAVEERRTGGRRPGRLRQDGAGADDDENEPRRGSYPDLPVRVIACLQVQLVGEVMPLTIVTARSGQEVFQTGYSRHAGASRSSKRDDQTLVLADVAGCEKWGVPRQQFGGRGRFLEYN